MVMSEASGVEGRVCKDIAMRQKLGFSKYGVTVEENPLELRAWLQHAYEEALDLAVYLKRVMEDLPEAEEERWKDEELYCFRCDRVSGSCVCGNGKEKEAGDE